MRVQKLRWPCKFNDKWWKFPGFLWLFEISFPKIAFTMLHWDISKDILPCVWPDIYTYLNNYCTCRTLNTAECTQHRSVLEVLGESTQIYLKHRPINAGNYCLLWCTESLKNFTPAEQQVKGNFYTLALVCSLFPRLIFYFECKDHWMYLWSWHLFLLTFRIIKKCY